jgi:S-DNA-T family DNA segregation ATPase FtsK/SpoIIIE
MKRKPASGKTAGSTRRPAGLSDRMRELLALVLVLVSLYALLSLLTFALPEPGAGGAPGDAGSQPIPRGAGRNLGGAVGYRFAHSLLFLFGAAAYALAGAVLASAILLFRRAPLVRPALKVSGVLVLTAALALWFAGDGGEGGRSAAFPFGPGGRFGANLSPILLDVLGSSGRFLVLLLCVVASILLVTESLLSTLLHRSAKLARSLWERFVAWRQAGEAALAPLAPAVGSDLEPSTPSKTIAAGLEPAPAPAHPSRPELEPEPIVDLKPAAKKPLKPKKQKAPPAPRRQEQLPFEEAYPFPPLELFRETVPQDDSLAQSQLESSADAIEKRLLSFKIDSKVVGVSIGPAVTQFELRIGEGIKVSRLTAYQDDLAMALKATAVRVVAPLPGRDTIGVEVPNRKRHLVVMRELLELYGRAEHLAIPLFLGKDVAGDPIVEDLARMPHLLIAGTTGSGKSVCINTILLSILMTRTPQQVRLILIDPKMVELQAFRDVPHLSCAVVSNMKKAPAVLAWAVDEMEKRYALCSAAGVKDIRGLNLLGQAELEKRLQRPVEPGEARMPYQVLVIDELADLMSVAQQEVEDSIQRLAQKSRSVGLHVILATQRPSTDVITGVIKANLPSQIAFKVSRKVDSRVILDCNGAEKLLGHGDLLFVPPSEHRLVRAQGTFVSDDEIRRVVEFLQQHGPRASYLPDLVQTETAGKKGFADRDDLYLQAVEVVLGQQRGSATLLQRALSVGYTRATRLLEMMEQDGLVGPFAGAKSRDVLMTLDEYKAREAQIAEELEQVETGVETGADADAELQDGEEELDEEAARER